MCSVQCAVCSVQGAGCSVQYAVQSGCGPCNLTPTLTFVSSLSMDASSRFRAVSCLWEWAQTAPRSNARRTHTRLAAGGGHGTGRQVWGWHSLSVHVPYHYWQWCRGHYKYHPGVRTHTLSRGHRTHLPTAGPEPTYLPVGTNHHSEERDALTGQCQYVPERWDMAAPLCARAFGSPDRGGEGGGGHCNTRGPPCGPPISRVSTGRGSGPISVYTSGQDCWVAVLRSPLPTPTPRFGLHGGPLTAGKYRTLRFPASRVPVWVAVHWPRSLFPERAPFGGYSPRRAQAFCKVRARRAPLVLHGEGITNFGAEGRLGHTLVPGAGYRCSGGSVGGVISRAACFQSNHCHSLLFRDWKF